MQNPFADLIPATNGPSAAPVVAPRVIAGTPRVDPYKERDQQLQEEAAQRAREDQQFQREKFEREMAKPGAADPKLVEAERTAAFLATRLVGSAADIARATKDKPSAAKPSVIGTVAGVLGSEARNFANDPERRRVEAAQMDLLDAALTLGTGAAYTKEQLEAYRESYFPRLTDDPASVADKKLRLRRLIEAAKVKAGNAAPQIDQALALLGEPSPLSEKQVTSELRDRISRGDQPAATIKWLIDNNRPPDEETIAAIMANYRNQNPDVRPPSGDNGRRLAMGVGDIAEGVGDIAGIVGNPLNYGINALTGSNLSTDLGQTFRDATGLPSPETDQELLASALNKGGVGALSLTGGARAAVPLARGAIERGVSQFSASPLVDTVAGASGGGAAEVARQQGAGPIVQGVAGLAGGVGGYAGAARIGRVTNPLAIQPNALMRAGQEEQVTVNRAMVDPSVQNRVTGVEATMAGGPIIRRGMERVGDQIESRVQSLGQGGQPLEPSIGGQTVQRALERDIKVSGQRAKRQYDRAERAAGDTKVAPTRSLQVVDDTISKLSETPEINQNEIAFLQKLRSDFQNDLSVGALRRVRTSLRKKISKGELTFGEDEATVLSIMDTAAEDISQGLAAEGKQGAARLFAKADADYRDRMDFIQGTVQKVIGKRNANHSPERIFANFKAMASPKGDEAGLARVIRTMEPEEQADIAATFADALGKNGKGEFSTAFLLSQAQKLPKAAIINLFGRDGARSLDNLRELAKEHARVMGGLNHSRTGVANDWKSWLGNLMFGGGAGIITESGMAGVAAAGAGLAAKGTRDVLSARALVSPDITQWLRNAPRTSDPKAINAHFARLSTIAARNPALAEEVQQIQQAITRAANDVTSPATSAAADENENPR